MKSTSAAHVIIHALWPGPGPVTLEVTCSLVSAPRAELFASASRSPTRCSSEGDGEGEDVWACSGETNATIPISNKIRIIARVRYKHANCSRQGKWRCKSHSKRRKTRLGSLACESITELGLTRLRSP